MRSERADPVNNIVPTAKVYPHLFQCPLDQRILSTRTLSECHGHETVSIRSDRADLQQWDAKTRTGKDCFQCVLVTRIPSIWSGPDKAAQAKFQCALVADPLNGHSTTHHVRLIPFQCDLAAGIPSTPMGSTEGRSWICFNALRSRVSFNPNCPKPPDAPTPFQCALIAYPFNFSFAISFAAMVMSFQCTLIARIPPTP